MEGHYLIVSWMPSQYGPTDQTIKTSFSPEPVVEQRLTSASFEPWVKISFFTLFSHQLPGTINCSVYSADTAFCFIFVIQP